jgi:16S rRNA (guanine966-N2)-methyltransferase
MGEAGRVIAGSARGVRLLAPPAVTRPLTDRVKQSLFGALLAQGVVGEGCAFLDLFAGSGAAGIEALSLGCRAAVLVERDAEAARVISSNLARAQVEGGSVIRRDVMRFLAADPPPTAPFDAVLLDPPYGDQVLVRALEPLGQPAGGWLVDGAIVVAKHFWRDEPPDDAGLLGQLREKRFGETMLTFYRYGP